MSGSARVTAEVGAVVVAYLLGSIPVADLVARRRAGVDLRRVGDRNPGYWNAKEQLGRRAALPVFAGDVAKGAAAALLGVVVDAVAPGDGHWWLAYACGFAAMVGHAWPVFAGFRGGRSVLTFVGAAIVLSPLTAAISIAVLLAVTAVRGFAWGARAGMFAFPFIQLVVDGPYRTAATGGLMSLIGLRFAMAAFADRADRSDRPDRPAAGDPTPDPQR
ncbi:MAG: glycerol-3-phosphate acyltransferase [Actinobacteria bacterium]|nr:glycerol-3-phosphate acyltransferase [Actinomycetota bacterium]